MISNNNKIKRLSEQVANQIAAGEVIERPASVVKELMENSIDANSDYIILKIKRSANSFISITDNGSGISKQDLPLAISQHATSKLVTLYDLQVINSFGFRGEALASICAAAKVKITSKATLDNNQDSDAWSIEIEGNPTQYKLLPASHPVGTTIEVRDLFFNMPVRRRFLKAERTEYQHILEVFQKIALSNFACAFTFICDEKIVYKLPKALNKAAQDNRVKKIFSISFINNADYFEGEAAGIKLYGWLSNAAYHRSQIDQQYFFLNNRAIRDKLILHAVKSVYGQVIPEGRHPCYVLYLELRPSEVDINVHPTKHEVRFCEPRWVYQFLVQQLNNVLYKQSLSKTTMSQVEDSESSIEVVDNTLSTSMHRASCTVPRDFSPLAGFRGQTTERRLEDKKLEKTFEQISESISESILPISSFGNIVADINNSFIISNYKKEYYLVDLNSAYSYLVYLELSKQWQLSQKLKFLDSLIIERISIEELYSLVLSCNYFFARERFEQSKDKFLECISKVYQDFSTFGFSLELAYSQNNDNAEILNSDTGELCNELIILAGPRACRYANIKDLLVLVTSFLILQDTNQDRDRFFVIMSQFAVKRLAANLLRIEQNAILDKLAKINYNDYQSNIPKLAKKLTEKCFSALMN